LASVPVSGRRCRWVSPLGQGRFPKKVQSESPTGLPASEPLRDRGFLERGGLALGTGLATLGIGLLILAGPVGWAAGTAAALAIAGGTTVSLLGAGELLGSYSGITTPKQEQELNKAAGIVGSLSSPGGIVGGVTGLMVTGDERGLQKGALYGGLAEGVLSLGIGLSRLRPGTGVFPEPTGEVSNETWLQFNKTQRSLYERGQLTLRDPVHGPLEALSPLERGRVLLERGTISSVNPLNLRKTWHTGFTPGARLIGVPFGVGFLRLAASIGSYVLTLPPFGPDDEH
jgi:hypothetical protein